jgi:hypothetical protein
LTQRKRERQRNKPPVNQHSENPIPKQDSCWAAELISEPKDKLHLTEGRS